MWQTIYRHPSGAVALRVKYCPLWQVFKYEQLNPNGLLIDHWIQQRTDQASGDSLIIRRYEA